MMMIFWLKKVKHWFNTENFWLGGIATAYSLSLDTDRTGDPSGESHRQILDPSVTMTKESGSEESGSMY